MRKPPPKGYLEASCTLAASYVFVAPLVAVYELGVTLDPQSRNGADPLFREIFGHFSHLGMIVLNMLLLAGLFFAIGHTRSRRIKVRGLYWSMLLESTLWACAFLAVGIWMPPGHFPDARPLVIDLPPMARGIVASIGAGVYEETIFRLVLMGGLVVVLRDLMGGHPGWAVPAALVVSSVLFSYAHHTIGGEAWDWQRFYYRSMMGGLLGLIFWFRGLGIAVWVHALYDVALVSRYV